MVLVPRSARALAVVACFVAVAFAACSGDAADERTVDEFDLSVVVDGLDRPTQITEGPDGLLLVAQLAGGENDATGEIVAVDVEGGTQRVIVDGLDKPTGVLWADGVVWIMVRRGLLRADWSDPSASAAEPVAVLDDLAFNGRSESTLTALGDGRFLYATTGTLSNGTAAPGSGTLWTFDPSDTTSVPVAVGLKNAYAHAVLDDGRVVLTEIGDSAGDPPVEEVDVVDVAAGASTVDFGWPDCPGDTDCAGIERPLALFPAASTPTGIAAIGNDIYVTLFVSGELMRLDRAAWVDGDPPLEPEVVMAELEGPHTVLARPDGSLWISEHFADRVVAVDP